MRKLCLSLTLCFVFNQLIGQGQPYRSIDSLLKPLIGLVDPALILYDRVTPLAHLSGFNQGNNSGHPQLFEQAISELYHASNGQQLLSHKTLRNYYTPDSLTSRTKVGILNASFQELNLTKDGQPEAAFNLADTLLIPNNNGQSSFRQKHVFMATPMKRFVVGPEVVFDWDPSLLVETTQGKRIASLWSDLGGNTPVLIYDQDTFIQNQLTQYFGQSGAHTMHFTAEFTDGSLQNTEAIIHVKIPNNNTDPLIDNGRIWGQIPWQGFNESTPYYGKLDYRIFYRTNNNNTTKTLIKPIVIIDGFDPEDRRKIQDSDPHPWSSDAEHRSIEDMMSYTNNQGEQTAVIPMLRSLGYDVVVVNHPTHWHNGVRIDGGADYIERNALTHVQLYQRLQTLLDQNNSTESLVIIGPSMGGQISRYALAYMEKHQIEHRTRLWVSIDSPHLGANIPIGVQTLLQLLFDTTGSIAAQDFIEQQLGSAAARQQLIEQYSSAHNGHLSNQWLDGRTISQGFADNRGRPIFINYYNNLFSNGLPNSLGYPMNLRKIALVNGSLTGNKTYKNPYSTLSTEYSGQLTSDQFGIAGGQSLKLKGIANDIGQLLGMETYFAPEPQETHKIAFFKKKSLWWSYYERYLTNNNSRGILDISPGGWFPTQTILAKDLTESTPCEWFIGQICINDWIINSLDHVNSFIPSVSALGLLHPDIVWDTPLDKNLLCQDAIPFDNYFGPKDNELHTSFTTESIAWLLDELNESPTPPSVYLEPHDLTGPNAVCYDTPASFSFDTCVAPEVIQWQTSPNLTVVTSDTHNITIEPNTTSSTTGYIEAHFTSQVIRKSVWIGSPLTPESIEGPTEVATGSVVTYNGGVAQGAASYEWWLPYPFDVQAPFDPESDRWQLPPGAGRTTTVFTGNGQNNGLVQLMGKNNCGLGDAAILSVIHDPSGSGQQQLPIYPYPNTSDNGFRLDFRSLPPGVYHMSIYDPYGNIVYQGQSGNIEKTIDTIGMSNGTYFLHIEVNQEMLYFQLIIQHN
ncbi:MAG: hypothetical protein ABR84_01615 [Cryomorphaceae bacterium BACL21 MAG-121220-bin10]|jgi:pimeloyl-ACP methyl ester carboxylesterase|nr:MAG: hypothetical protein ABR84_01615 [Cryomorphaceae bacterium BACL21 MAG-121220-bin10]MDB9782785.1 T9SS type A sorting domain-containing protein [Winogradskyella sp.]